jgi:hypothetical protein
MKTYSELARAISRDEMLTLQQRHEALERAYDEVLAEYNRRQALPGWRRWLLKQWRAL